MIEQQQKLILSPYIEIYELVVPKDNLLRQIKELVDFEFIYNELLDKYCLDNGRNAVLPIRMFKYLLLKAIYDLSDVDVVERCELLGNKLPEHLKSGGIPPFSGCVHDTNTACLSAMQLLLLFLDFLVRLRTVPSVFWIQKNISAGY